MSFSTRVYVGTIAPEVFEDDAEVELQRVELACRETWVRVSGGDGAIFYSVLDVIVCTCTCRGLSVQQRQRPGY